MPSLIDMRRRIRAVKSTQQITKAMKMVAASKLRRAQAAAEAARPFAERMEKVLGAQRRASKGDGSRFGRSSFEARAPRGRLRMTGKVWS